MCGGVIGEFGKSGRKSGCCRWWDCSATAPGSGSGRMGLIPCRDWRVGTGLGITGAAGATAGATGLGRKEMKAWCNSWKPLGCWG